MGRNGIFWGIYMLFFAIPFPMILYYSITGSDAGRADSSPLMIMVWLSLSALLWIIFLYQLLKSWLLDVFTVHARITRLMAEGTLVPARVTDCVVAGQARKGVESLNVTLSFTNFAGEAISETMPINDSKPFERRYETGNTVDLRIDPELKQPCVLPASTVTRFKKGVLVLRITGWLLIAAAVAGYYYYSYWFEGQGQNWRFMIFWHPLILCPLMLLFYERVIGGLLRKHLGPGKHDLRLKLYGRKTMATLKSASQTGLSVNDQPQLLFVLEYTDDLGKKYQVSFKKIVSLLELDIARKEEIAIFYLPDAPLTVAFASDLE
ncbi:hypothetical protein [Taibaiella chishuiensis]|uniref:Uncharacterized protein n=1 Tax=Taibaiella chishuiensis TaxID=1434707 RepID=A0A2P8D1M3_9BACT|nr:hypothetical protein [Taibaiella chishuiensis]PSK91124.1 hypothetical protein B0I18_106135 [Taibaiella chishuiensis]